MSAIQAPSGNSQTESCIQATSKVYYISLTTAMEKRTPEQLLQSDIKGYSRLLDSMEEYLVSCLRAKRQPPLSRLVRYRPRLSSSTLSAFEFDVNGNDLSYGRACTPALLINSWPCNGLYRRCSSIPMTYYP